MNTRNIDNPPIIFLFVKPFGKFDNELWEDKAMRDTLKIHVVESPETKFSTSYILSMAVKLHELGYKRGFDYMICYHKESEEEHSKNVIVLHTTDEIFGILKEDKTFSSLEITKEF